MQMKSEEFNKILYNTMHDHLSFGLASPQPVGLLSNVCENK